MAEPTEQTLTEALRDIADPATGRDIVAAGLVEGILLRDGLVQVTLLTDRHRAAAMEPVRREVERALTGLAGVRNVTAVLTSTTRPAPPTATPTPATHAHPPTAERSKLLTEAGAVIAVASGKGGVGKSTVAVNLAVALARQGLSVGLLDADIYGPSLPRMLGLDRRPEIMGDRMIPLDAWGLRAMSIGFLVDEETAMIWRGPMVMGALVQLMEQVEWGAPDVMVIDMPPGTGDVALTLSQRVRVAGAVIVSTPQDIALVDARRAVAMFRKTGVPIAGIVENMSYFSCPKCGHDSHVFGHGGARAEAARLGVPFLGELPLLAEVRSAGDAGTPIMASAPESTAGRAFRALALQLDLGRARS